MLKVALKAVIQDEEVLYLADSALLDANRDDLVFQWTQDDPWGDVRRDVNSPVSPPASY